MRRVWSSDVSYKKIGNVLTTLFWFAFYTMIFMRKSLETSIDLIIHWMVVEKETVNEIKKVTTRAGNCCSSTAKSKKISESKLNVPGFDPPLKR